MWMCGSKIFTAKPLTLLSFVYYIQKSLKTQAQVQDPVGAFLRRQPDLGVGHERPLTKTSPHENGRAWPEVRALGPLDIVVQDAARHPGPHGHPIPSQRGLV